MDREETSTHRAHAELSAEELIVILRQGGPEAPAALEVLLARFTPDLPRRIKFLAGRIDYLPPAELDEAQDEAVLWLLKTIAEYDPVKKCSFSTFLNHVLRAHLRDYQRRWWRRVGRLHCHGRVEEVIEGQTAMDDLLTPRQSAEGRGIASPETIAIRHERLARLEQARQALSPHEQFLYEEILKGTRHRELADKLGVSLVTARRQRTALIHKLRLQLWEKDV